MDRRHPALGLVVSGLLLAACSGGTSPAPSASSPGASVAPSEAPGSSTPPSGSPGPTPEPTVVLRATETQAILPIYRFGWLPILVVTADGRAIQPGPVAEISPGPLVPPVEVRPVTAAGVARIVADARAAGLLSGETDFSGGPAMMGGTQARLQLSVDGVSYDLVGDPSKLVRCDPGTRCLNPSPGTPEAFAAFWARLTALDAWLGADVGTAAAYAPDAFSILIGPGPADPTPGVGVVVWPLDSRFAFFGDPVLTDTSLRCGTVTGQEAQILAPSLYRVKANQAWIESPVMSMSYGLTVRPVLPGDGDPCAELTTPAG